MLKIEKTPLGMVLPIYLEMNEIRENCMALICYQVDPKKMPVGELKPNVMSSSKAATFGSTGYSSVVIMTSSLILVALLSTVITSSSVASMLTK